MSGFPQAFVSAVASGALDKPVLTNGRALKYLTEGEHEVRVAGVDRTKLADNKLTIKYASDEGAEHNDMLYFTEQDRKTGAVGINWKVLKSISALLPSEQALHAFNAEVAANNPEVLDLLIGLRLTLKLKRGKGYVIDYVNGEYVAYESATKDEYARGHKVDEVKAAVEALGIKRAFMNVEAYIASHGEQNVKAFELSLPSLQKPKVAVARFNVAV